MSRQPLITEEVFTEFAVLVVGGMQRKKAAQQVGHDVKALRNACKRLGLTWPGRTLLTEQIKEFEPEILAGTISQHQIATELDCSQAHVSILYKKLGYPALPSGNPGLSKVTERERTENCEKVIEHIETHGGYLKTAVRELGFPDSFRLHVAAYAKTIGFDFELYRFAHRNYGFWRTLPGKAKRVYTCDYLLPAVCTKCGTTHDVSLINMRTGASTQCMSCAAEQRKGSAFNRKCVCDETGQVFPSIRKLSQRLDLPTSSLNSLFLRDGCALHNGLTYRLAD